MNEKECQSCVKESFELPIKLKGPFHELNLDYLWDCQTIATKNSGFHSIRNE